MIVIAAMLFTTSTTLAATSPSTTTTTRSPTNTNTSSPTATPIQAPTTSAPTFLAKDVGTAAPAFFGFAGAFLALVLSNIGAALGICDAGIGLATIGPMTPELVMKNIIPVVLAGVSGVYGLIIAVLISINITKPEGDMNVYTWNKAWRAFNAGLCVGGSGLWAGWSIGVVSRIGIKCVGLNPNLFTPMILILGGPGAVALFGLIVGLILLG
jgi:V-type H+-transporting ATPase proteolipid subunit